MPKFIKSTVDCQRENFNDYLNNLTQKHLFGCDLFAMAKKKTIGKIFYGVEIVL
jgi:hypothetical protein